MKDRNNPRRPSWASPGPRGRGDVAMKDWFVRARLRVRTEHRSSSMEPLALKIFRPGEEVEMVQWGRAGQEVDVESWWTSQDFDAAHIIPAGKVEVLEVLEEQLPDADA